MKEKSTNIDRMPGSANHLEGLRNERSLVMESQRRRGHSSAGGHGTFEGDKPLSATPHRSILVKNAPMTCTLVLGIYIALQYLVFENHEGPNPVCNYDAQYSATAKYVALFSALCFGASFVMQMYLIIADKLYFLKSHMFSVYATAMTVNVIAGTSSYMTYMYDWGGLCKDYFGVVSPAAQWPEWITTVPFLVYITISIDTQKRSLVCSDYVVIFGMALCIAMGWALQLQLPGDWSAATLIFANLTILSTIFLVHRAQGDPDRAMPSLGSTMLPFQVYESLPTSSETLPEDVSVYTERAAKEISTEVRMKTLSYLLFVVFPLFPVIYIAALVGLLDYNWTYIGFQFAGLVAKLLFTALAVRSHSNVLDEIVKLLELEIQPMIQNIITGEFVSCVCVCVRACFTLTFDPETFFFITKQYILNNIFCMNSALDIEDWTKEELSV